MGTIFEDVFSKLQIDMLSICMEYVEDRAEKIYIYCSCEENVISSNFFYKINGKVVEKHKINDVLLVGQEKYDVSASRQLQVIDIINEDIMELKKLSEENNREMPTQIKLVYDVVENELNADYSYDSFFSNQQNKTSYEICNEWCELERVKESR